MLTLEQARKRRKEIRDRLKEMLETARKEDRDLTAEESTEFDSLDAEARTCEDVIRRDERTAQLDRDVERRDVTPPAPDPDRRRVDRDDEDLEERDRGARRRAPAVHTREDRDYSFIALARAIKSGDRSQCRVERRASDEIRERVGREPEGFFVPYLQLLGREDRAKALQEERDITKATTGASLVGVDLMPNRFVEILRNETVVGMLGATMLENLEGDVDLPRQIAAGVVAWLATETTDVSTDTTFDTDEVQLRPKTAGIRHDITRRMMKQSTPAVDDLVRRDIRATVGIAIDHQALNGDGTGGTPTGIVNMSGAGAVDLTGGATWADIVEFETDLGSANALRGKLAYAVRHATVGTLKTTKKDAGSGLFLIDADGMMNGYPVAKSNQLDAAAPIIFGNWEELLIGMWGVLDMFPDPYTLGDRGGVVLRGFQDVDVQARHEASFSVGT